MTATTDDIGRLLDRLGEFSARLRAPAVPVTVLAVTNGMVRVRLDNGFVGMTAPAELRGLPPVPRASRVRDWILARLADGPATILEMEDGLRCAGLPYLPAAGTVAALSREGVITWDTERRERPPSGRGWRHYKIWRLADDE